MQNIVGVMKRNKLIFASSMRSWCQNYEIINEVKLIALMVMERLSENIQLPLKRKAEFLTRRRLVPSTVYSGWGL